MTVVNKSVLGLGKKRYKSESANLIVEALRLIEEAKNFDEELFLEENQWHNDMALRLIEEGKKAKERLVEETRGLLNQQYTQHQLEYDELMCLKEEWLRKKP